MNNDHFGATLNRIDFEITHPMACQIVTKNIYIRKHINTTIWTTFCVFPHNTIIKRIMTFNEKDQNTFVTLIETYHAIEIQVNKIISIINTKILVPDVKISLRQTSTFTIDLYNQLYQKSKDYQNKREYHTIFNVFNNNEISLNVINQKNDVQDLFKNLNYNAFCNPNLELRKELFFEFIDFDQQTKRQKIPITPNLLPNCWALILPLLPCNDSYKQKHYWIYSKNPSRGKTVINDILTKQYHQYQWKYDSDFQDNLSQQHSMIIFDEFASQITQPTLQKICDQNYFSNIKNSKNTIQFQGHVVILSNFTPNECYQNQNITTIESRFFIINVDNYKPNDMFRNYQEQISTWNAIPTLSHFLIQCEIDSQFYQIKTSYERFIRELQISLNTNISETDTNNEIFQKIGIQLFAKWEYIQYLKIEDQTLQTQLNQRTLSMTHITHTSENYKEMAKIKKQIKDSTTFTYQFKKCFYPFHQQPNPTVFFDQDFYQLLINIYNSHMKLSTIKNPMQFQRTIERLYQWTMQENNIQKLYKLMEITEIWLLPIPLASFSLKLIPFIAFARNQFLNLLPITVPLFPKFNNMNTIQRTTVIISHETLNQDILIDLYLYKKLIQPERGLDQYDPYIEMNLVEKQIDILNEEIDDENLKEREEYDPYLTIELDRQMTDTINAQINYLKRVEPYELQELQSAIRLNKYMKRMINLKRSVANLTKPIKIFSEDIKNLTDDLSKMAGPLQININNILTSTSDPNDKEAQPLSLPKTVQTSIINQSQIIQSQQQQEQYTQQQPIQQLTLPQSTIINYNSPIKKSNQPQFPPHLSNQKQHYQGPQSTKKRKLNNPALSYNLPFNQKHSIDKLDSESSLKDSLDSD